MVRDGIDVDAGPARRAGCEPSSELRIAEHFYRQSALSELLGVPAHKVNEDRLYRALNALLPHKEALEAFLKERLGALFELEYDLMLYEVTSTHFEGEAKANPLARRGYSRDHRPDRPSTALWAVSLSNRKQVCIGLVVSKCGMPFGYEVFPGNRQDGTTLQEIVETMEARYGKANRIWVVDRGMVSETNMSFLASEGRRYIVGTPKAILKRFERRIEEGLAKLSARLERAKKRPNRSQVERQIGRLLGGNSRAAGLFDIQVKEIERNGAPGFLELTWSKRQAWRDWASLSEGCCLLRSNVTDWSAEELWQAYIQLTEAEAAFRIQKSDLSIRRIWHQEEERVLAHILVCFLAYVLCKSLGRLCRAAGLGDEPRRVLDELSKISVVDVVLPTRGGIEIRKRCVTRPTDHQAILLQRLGLRLPSHVRMIKTITAEVGLDATDKNGVCHAWACPTVFPALPGVPHTRDRTSPLTSPSTSSGP